MNEPCQCRSVLSNVAVCSVAVSFQTLQCVTECCSVAVHFKVCGVHLQCAAMCCSVLQCVAVCCSVLEREKDGLTCDRQIDMRMGVSRA